MAISLKQSIILLRKLSWKVQHIGRKGNKAAHRILAEEALQHDKEKFWIADYPDVITGILSKDELYGVNFDSMKLQLFKKKICFKNLSHIIFMQNKKD